MSDQNSNADNNSLSRMTRGEKLAKEKTILENGDGSFSVPSQTVEEIAYLVRFLDGKFICNCMDFKQRHEQIGLCKHIHAVKFWVASQTFLQEKPKPKIFSPDSIQCEKCGSIRVVRYGFSDGKQIFKCKDCRKKFREPSLLKKAHYSPETVCLTLDLYFSGMSLRKIARTVSDNFGEDLAYTTIYSWIQKFIPKISEYVNSLAPQLSDSWHADELFVKKKGGIEYKGKTQMALLWNVMDRKTRYNLALKLTPMRDRSGALQTFREAQKNAHGDYPEQIFTDSLPSYNGIRYMNTAGWNPKHIANCGVNKGYGATNNRIERMNGTLRERIKVQRGWKSIDTKIPEGMRIHYNFVKPHEALEGMTPAQRAGIQIKNRWLDLLRLSMTKRSKLAS